jgi:hypothetical protein
MTTTWDEAGARSLAFARLSSLLEGLRSIPAFGPVVTDEYRLGYSAARNDVVAMVDVEVTELLGIYEVLEVASRLFDPSKLGDFLARPIADLGGRSPVEAMNAGDSASVLQILAAEYEGQVG